MTPPSPKLPPFARLFDSIHAANLDGVKAFVAARPDVDWTRWPLVDPPDTSPPRAQLAKTYYQMKAHPLLLVLMVLRDDRLDDVQGSFNPFTAAVMTGLGTPTSALTSVGNPKPRVTGNRRDQLLDIARQLVVSGVNPDTVRGGTTPRSAKLLDVAKTMLPEAEFSAFESAVRLRSIQAAVAEVRQEKDDQGPGTPKPRSRL